MKKKNKVFEEEFSYEKDDNFAFIAGYTDGGIPFGITWDEQEQLDKIEKKDEDYKGINYKIDLEKVIEAIQLTNDQIKYYYYKKTGEIISITEEEQRMADDCELSDLLIDREWQDEFIELAIDIEENWNDYILLPDELGIHKYKIMTEFAYSIEDNNKSNILLNILDSRSAFEKIKNKLELLGLNKKWYEFRDNRYKEIAIEWCNDNNLIWIDKSVNKE